MSDVEKANLRQAILANKEWLLGLYNNQDKAHLNYGSPYQLKVLARVLFRVCQGEIPLQNSDASETLKRRKKMKCLKSNFGSMKSLKHYLKSTRQQQLEASYPLVTVFDVLLYSLFNEL
jgi:hypothetical protein